MNTPKLFVGQHKCPSQWNQIFFGLVVNGRLYCRSFSLVRKGCKLLFFLFIDPHQAKPLLVTTRLMAAQLWSPTKGADRGSTSISHLFTTAILSAPQPRYNFRRGQCQAPRLHSWLTSPRCLLPRREIRGHKLLRQVRRRLAGELPTDALDLPSVLGTLPEKPCGDWLLPRRWLSALGPPWAAWTRGNVLPGSPAPAPLAAPDI